MKKFFKILFVLVMFISFPVFAESNKLYDANDDVKVKEEVNGTGFYAGENVDLESKVNGILFAAGYTVNTKSESDYAFVAGNTLNVDTALFKDGFFAGNTVYFNNVNVERDLYAFGTQINFDGTIGRNAYVGGSKVKIKGTITGDLSVYSSDISIEEGTTISGTLKDPEDAKISIDEAASVNETELIKNTDIKTTSKKATFVSKLFDTLFSFINILVVGLLLLLCVPKLFEKISKLGKESILSNLGFGLVSLIFIPLASIIFICTVFGTSLGIVLLCVYGLSIYLSGIFTCYYLSNLFLGEKIKNRYALLALGLLVLYLVKLIPFLGGLVTLCVVCMGLGILINILFKRK